MSIQSNFPSIKPTLLLDFANTKALDPRITFTRASTATYFDQFGVMQTAAAGVARFDHNPTTYESLGMLIEEQRTNLLTYSEQFDNAAWTKTTGTTVATNAATAPDGTVTADNIVYNGSGLSGSYRIYATALTSVNGVNYTSSIYMRADAPTTVRLYGNTVAGGYVTCNLTTQWQRFSTTGTGNGISGCQLMIYSASGDNSPFSIYIWGAQLEAGAFPTSYIKTEASQVTRSADAASMTGTNFSSWYRSDEGTMYAEAAASRTFDAGRLIFDIGDGSLNNRISIATSGASTNSVFLVNVANVAQCSISGTSAFASGSAKIAGSYKVDDFAASSNGNAVGTDSSGTIPVVNQAAFGRTTSNQVYWNGTIKKVAYYPIRVTNAQDQGLTS